ncbi:unknown [Firmicutes bacterium CAG:83]|nr:unknown [Firmicutes bacterium CAG:83]
MLHLEKQIVRLNADIRSLDRDIASYEKLASFIDDYVVFIEDDGTNLYHKFNCYKFRGDSFWVYNTENAVQRGFSPCPICN